MILSCARCNGTHCISTVYYLDSWDLCFNAGPTKTLVTMIAKTEEHLQVHTTFINRKSKVKLSNTKYKAKNYLFKCFGILLSCQSKLNTNPLSLWIFYIFFIVSEKLSKLSIPLNNTKLTMFYTFHKNWQCVKSALNCFCFWSLYIFLGNLLCILREIKESIPKYFFSKAIHFIKLSM